MPLMMAKIDGEMPDRYSKWRQCIGHGDISRLYNLYGKWFDKVLDVGRENSLCGHPKPVVWPTPAMFVVENYRELRYVWLCLLMDVNKRGRDTRR